MLVTRYGKLSTNGDLKYQQLLVETKQKHSNNPESKMLPSNDDTKRAPEWGYAHQSKLPVETPLLGKEIVPNFLCPNDLDHISMGRP